MKRSDFWLPIVIVIGYSLYALYGILSPPEHAPCASIGISEMFPDCSREGYK